MANLTITIDDEMLKRARIRALQQGTSVNALLREYLKAYSGEESSNQGLREFIQQAQNTKSGSGTGGRSWKRDDLYER